MYLCVYICMYVCTYVCKRPYLYLSMYVCMYVWCVGDSRGMLIALALCVDVQHPGKVSSLSIDFLGVTSVPETISFLGRVGLVFVGSVFGDSQLIKLLPEKSESGSAIEVLYTYIHTYHTYHTYIHTYIHIFHTYSTYVQTCTSRNR